MKPRPRARQSGYALLVTLALVALAAASLASLARYSMAHASAASRLELDLQRRWGAMSFRQALLPTAEQRLNAAHHAYLELAHANAARPDSSARSRPPAAIPRTIRIEHTLGSVHFTALLRDESARLNVNALNHRAPANTSQLRRSLAALLGPDTRLLRLDPHRPPALRNTASDTTPPLRLICTFDQLFDAPDPLALIGPALDDTGLAAQITCWGSGKLNVSRASPPAIRALLAGLVPDSRIAAFLDQRRNNPRLASQAILAAIATDKTAHRAVERLITDQSDCYSVWVAAQVNQRLFHQWVVYETSPNGPTCFEFAW